MRELHAQCASSVITIFTLPTFCFLSVKATEIMVGGKTKFPKCATQVCVKLPVVKKYIWVSPLLEEKNQRLLKEQINVNPIQLCGLLSTKNVKT